MIRKHLSSILLLLAASCAATVPLRAQAPAAAVDAEAPTAPVEIDGVVLFEVRGVSSYSAETRAHLIRDRLIAVAADSSIPVEAIRAVDSEGMTRLAAGDR